MSTNSINFFSASTADWGDFVSGGLTFDGAAGARLFVLGAGWFASDCPKHCVTVFLSVSLSIGAFKRSNLSRDRRLDFPVVVNPNNRNLPALNRMKLRRRQ